MNKRTIVMLVTIAGGGLSSCQDRENSQVGGIVLGGAAGGLLGATIGAGTGQLAAVGVGAILGAFAGNEIAQSIHSSDHHYAEQESKKAFKKEGVSSWTNPSTGHSGTIKTGPEKFSGGKYYKEYTQTIYIDGKAAQAHGRAHRMPDGSWKIEN